MSIGKEVFAENEIEPLLTECSTAIGCEKGIAYEMNPPLQLKSIRCAACGDHRILGPEEMANRLRADGKLRREAKPDSELVLELFQKELAQESCGACGATSLVISDYEMDEDDWGDPILCEICKCQIPPERLEIFPNEKRCAGCKEKPGLGDDQPEFCEACGGLMEMRQRGGAGIAAYVMACSDCGRSG